MPVTPNPGFQYQIHTEPIFSGGETVNADKWLYRWSEPVRVKQDPKATIALMASGLFFFPVQGSENITADKWLYQWSEPVRTKPRLDTGLNQVLALFPVPIVPFGWYQDFGEQAQLMRKRPEFGAHLQRSTTLEAPTQPPSAQLIQWYSNLSEPVMQLRWLKAANYQAYTSPDRLLPTPNVTVTMAATETNNDVFLGAVNVYNGSGTVSSNQGARVSITEVHVGQDPVSVRET